MWYLETLMPDHAEDAIAVLSQAVSKPTAHGSVNSVFAKQEHGGFVARHKQRVVGCVVYRMLSEAIVVEHVAVADKHRRSGIGTSLIGAVSLSKLTPRRKLIVCPVRDSLLGIHLWLRDALRFKCVSVMRQDYVFVNSVSAIGAMPEEFRDMKYFEV